MLSSRVPVGVDGWGFRKTSSLRHLLHLVSAHVVRIRVVFILSLLTRVCSLLILLRLLQNNVLHWLWNLGARLHDNWLALHISLLNQSSLSNHVVLSWHSSLALNNLRLLLGGNELVRRNHLNLTVFNWGRSLVGRSSVLILIQFSWFKVKVLASFCCWRMVRHHLNKVRVDLLSVQDFFGIYNSTFLVF